MYFKNKKVLVTGGTGMIGTPLVNMLAEAGARVRIASLDNPFGLPEGAEFLKVDLTRWEACLKACEGVDFIFHLAGIKGGVGVGRSQGARFLEGNAFINLHMLKAARECGAARYLFTSTIGVYPDAEIFKESEVWDKPPHPSDWYGAWAKRFGELQCEAYLEQYDYQAVIVRPANIYGPYDNFNPNTAMVIPALIARACAGEDPLVVWGDGTPVRDFIYSKDCARGMMLAMEAAAPCDPLNLGSGVGVSIKQVAETICRYAPQSPKLEWDASKPAGNKIRLMDTTKARDQIGFEPKYSLENAIRETVEWYLQNPDYQSRRYSIFSNDPGGK
ncbi:MAG: NAD-dependent epimerase/dehydratase family protein [Candidatus Omnitrophota bacterium]|nr:NAD-dependent epimerase/dehydratase family protein [Candidatus Omnitrophota bacterium]